MTSSHSNAQVLRIAYLGPPGTYTEEAALLYAPSGTRVPFSTPSAVATAVESGMADEGIVAIENSLEGAVPDTLDLLIHDSTLHIRHEIVIPILHCLLAKEGTAVEQVEAVYSHPQALGQCRKFIEQCFPKAQAVAALSTAAAVEQMLAQPHAAAIGNRRAAELYGATILAQGIQDSPNNVTRFVVLAAEDHEPTQQDKTSLCFGFNEDRPGTLVSVLEAFSNRGINMTKIESRPTKENLGKYIFLVDIEGHRSQSPVKEALDEVLEHSEPQWFRIFGSYPRYQNNGA